MNQGRISGGRSAEFPFLISTSEKANSSQMFPAKSKRDLPGPRTKKHAVLHIACPPKQTLWELSRL